MTSTPTLNVANLSISYGSAELPLRAVRDVSFRIQPGEAFGLIGESGSGKTTVAFSVMDYRNGARVDSGEIQILGQDLHRLSREELRKMRGNRVAMVYQDPMDSLNPGLKVGEQIAEILREHSIAEGAEAWSRSVELLRQVHLPEPEEFAQRFPHQLSGGQQQRVVIAMALACDPDLLIMDEPTTGLDVTTEAVILDLINELRERVRSSILFISHNIAVVAKVCDRVGVLYAGELVEEGPCGEVIRKPRHPYTMGLIAAMPLATASDQPLNAIKGSLPDLRYVPEGCVFAERCAHATDDCRRARPDHVAVGERHLSRCIRTDQLAKEGKPAHSGAAKTVRLRTERQGVMLRTTDLAHWYRSRTAAGLFRRPPPVRAVDGVSLDLLPGKTLAIVGESGSGKSTLARSIAGLLPPTRGAIEFWGEKLRATAAQRGTESQRRIQFVFQNPTSALNPRFTVEEIIARPLRLYDRATAGMSLRDRVVEIMASVNLPERYLSRYPHELSGGEKQRVSIARVIGVEPDLVICDEPTSALDISVQAAVLNELKELQARFGMSYLFISHDLGVVRYIADTVAIMYLGRIVEQGPTATLFQAPHHPYTESLVSAIPRLDASGDQPEIRLAGTVPASGAEIRGCPFASRCPRRVGSICDTTAPPVQELEQGRTLACHIPIDELAELQLGGQPKHLVEDPA